MGRGLCKIRVSRTNFDSRILPRINLDMYNMMQAVTQFRQIFDLVHSCSEPILTVCLTTAWAAQPGVWAWEPVS